MFKNITKCFGLLFLFVIVYADDNNLSVKTKDERLIAYSYCVYSMEIPLADILKIEKIPDPLNRLILKCVYEDMGLYSEEYGFHIDRIVERIGGGDENRKIVEKCLPSNSNDAPEVQIMTAEECFKAEKVGEYRYGSDVVV